MSLAPVAMTFQFLSLFFLLLTLAACSDGGGSSGSSTTVGAYTSGPGMGRSSDARTPGRAESNQLSVADIAPNSVYLGTRLEEPFAYTYATRLYVSHDRGVVWEQLSPIKDGPLMKPPMAGPSTCSPIAHLRFLCLYAVSYWGGYGSGLYVSYSYGHEWGPLDGPSSCPTLQIDPRNGTDFFATVSGHHISGFHFSKDGGQNWQNSGYGDDGIHWENIGMPEQTIIQMAITQDELWVLAENGLCVGKLEA